MMWLFIIVVKQLLSKDNMVMVVKYKFCVSFILVDSFYFFSRFYAGYEMVE